MRLVEAIGTLRDPSCWRVFSARNRSHRPDELGDLASRVKLRVTPELCFKTAIAKK
jgi:hypothetical protein